MERDTGRGFLATRLLIEMASIGIQRRRWLVGAPTSALFPRARIHTSLDRRAACCHRISLSLRSHAWRVAIPCLGRCEPMHRRLRAHSMSSMSAPNDLDCSEPSPSSGSVTLYQCHGRASLTIRRRIHGLWCCDVSTPLCGSVATFRTSLIVRCGSARLNSQLRNRDGQNNVAPTTDI